MTYFEAHCLICNRNWILELPIEPSVFRMKWDIWGRGGLIQDVFPELNDDQREALKTGTHPACWDKIFKDQE